MSNVSVKALYMVSALLNFNVTELFNTIIKEYIIDLVNASPLQTRKLLGQKQECIVF